MEVLDRIANGGVKRKLEALHIYEDKDDVNDHSDAFGSQSNTKKKYRRLFPTTYNV